MKANLEYEQYNRKLTSARNFNNCTNFVSMEISFSSQLSSNYNLKLLDEAKRIKNNFVVSGVTRYGGSKWSEPRGT